MNQKKTALVLFFTLFLIMNLFGQDSFYYPRLQNMPPKINITGQSVISPLHPMAFSKQNGNPGIWALMPYSGVINMQYGDHINSIRNTTFFGGFKISDDLFLGIEAGGLMVPAGWKYDLDSLQYRAFDSDAVFGYWVSSSIGYQIIEGLSAGINLGIYSEEISQGVASSFTGDVGIVWSRFYSDFTLGLSYRNFGSEFTWKDSLQNSLNSPQPSVLNFGIAYDWKSNDIALFPQVGIESSENAGTVIAAGLGFSWKERITLQASGAFGGDIIIYPWSVGLQGSFEEIHLHYTAAATESGDLSHLIGFSWNFGGKHPQTTLAPDVEKKQEIKYYRGAVKVEPLPMDTSASLIPDPPRNTRLREDGAMVILEWDPVVVGDKFLVYAKMGEKSVFRKVTSSPISATEFAFKKPSANTHLFFYVKTARGDKISGPSRVVSFANE